KSLTTFQDINLIEPIQRALVDQDYTSPTPIQEQAIPPALTGQDILGCAQTGTGKTASFALPILNQLGKHKVKAIPKHPHALILSPTRELAIQIGDSIADYGRHLNIRHATIFGGVGQGKQVNALNRGAHILVATPGRLIDLMGQGHIHLSKLRIFVLDEADRMMDMGFLPALKRIIDHLPDKRQSLFFSATLPSHIVELSRKLLTRPVCIDVSPKVRAVELIEQQVRFVPRSQKRTVLKEILNAPDVGQALVFTRTKRGADFVAKDLNRGDIASAVIHGNKSQNARQRALAMFRDEKARVLVATDVAARGLDIDGITHVVNFEMPVDIESYVHRIGRTGRAGAAGIAISLCTAAERPILRAVEKLIGRKIPVEGPECTEPEEEAVQPAKHPYFRRGGGPGKRKSGGGRGKTGAGKARSSRRRKPQPTAKGSADAKKRPATTTGSNASSGNGGIKAGSNSGGTVSGNGSGNATGKPGRKRRRRRRSGSKPGTQPAANKQNKSS
ncbi:UNVERIFIED_CONTAM: hypothetical protein GTU68_033661, partial [Idotea baltica]|nr:hypothetical protein [Idotea baltica]